MKNSVFGTMLIVMFFSTTCMAIEQISDPTMPANYQANKTVVVNDSKSSAVAETQEWLLNSTIISPYLRIAIINGKQLKRGEKINGATVKNIEHQQVELSYEGSIITLSLHRSFISKIKSAP